VAERHELADHVLAMLSDDPDQRPALLGNWVAQLRRSSLFPGPADPSLPDRAPRRNPSRPRAQTPGRHRRGVALRTLSPRLLALASTLLVVVLSAALLTRFHLTKSTATDPSHASPTTSLSPPISPDLKISATTLPSPASVQPPWSQPVISSGQARLIGLAEWKVAAAEGATAQLLLPADVGLSSRASARRANIAIGDWAIAWDDPGRPGVYTSGGYCPDCGRGTTVVSSSSSYRGSTSPDLTWADGSTASFFVRSGVTDQLTFVPDVQWLAVLFIPNQDRFYEIWTYNGQDHLLYLIGQLRFVQGAP